MAARQMNSIVQLIRNAAASPDNQDDGRLLSSFLADNDQAAFAAIIQRHGPMVLGICQRVLNDFHAAEDAFQATFILLAQQAASIRKKESLASWLHGVGLRMARETRRARARRSQHEGQPSPKAQPADPAHIAAWREIQTILDEAIQALPTSYREPFVRHCLEQASCAEIARHLGLEEATVRQRLSRARKRLQDQLKLRGISLTAVLAGIAVSGAAAPAVFANTLVSTTARAAVHVASGEPLAIAVPQNVIALIQGVSKAMFITRIKVTAILFAAFVGVGTTFGIAAQKEGGVSPKQEPPRTVEVPTLLRGSGDSFQLQLPTTMPGKLGIQIGEVRQRAATKQRVLQLSGSTAFDPTKLARIRTRVPSCEVIKVGKVAAEMGIWLKSSIPPDAGRYLPQVLLGPKSLKSSVEAIDMSEGTDELRAGDKVSKEQVLVILSCSQVGEKKADLFDAITQLKLDELILEKAEKSPGAVPEVFILNAKKSVLSDLSSVTRSANQLKGWGVPDNEIEAIRKEARETAENAKPGTEEQRKDRLKEWSRVVLRAPFDGIIVERNINAREVITDGTTNLFQIANTDRLLVIANVPEDDLPSLSALDPKERRWSVKPPGGTTAVEGMIEEIGYLIDPNQHTAIVKGYIDNNGHQLRAGQFVTASIALPLASDEMSLAASAIVEEKGESFVFVQPDANKPVYEQRRVLLVRRGHDVVHIRTRLTPDQGKQGYQTIKMGERVVTANAIELKAILDELKAP